MNSPNISIAWPRTAAQPVIQPVKGHDHRPGQQTPEGGILRANLPQRLPHSPEYCGMGGDIITEIDFDNINDAIVYDIFQVEGNEGEALNDIYLELFELLGRDAMLKIYTHFHGDKIDCPCACIARSLSLISPRQKQTDRNGLRSPGLTAAWWSIATI